MNRKDGIMLLFIHLIAPSSHLIVGRWLLLIDFIIFTTDDPFFVLKCGFYNLVLGSLLWLPFRPHWNNERVLWSRFLILEIFIVNELFHGRLSNFITFNEETSINIILIVLNNGSVATNFLRWTLELRSRILNASLLLQVFNRELLHTLHVSILIDASCIFVSV